LKVHFRSPLWRFYRSCKDLCKAVTKVLNLLKIIILIITEGIVVVVVEVVVLLGAVNCVDFSVEGVICAEEVSEIDEEFSEIDEEFSEIDEEFLEIDEEVLEIDEALAEVLTIVILFKPLIVRLLVVRVESLCWTVDC
jgi:hypothetical protein